MLSNHFILSERTGYWKMKVKERSERLCCIMPSFIFPAGSTHYRSLFHMKIRVWSGGCVFLFLLIILAEIKSSVSPFSLICRFLLLNSIRKLYEFSLPFWPEGSFYLFFSRYHCFDLPEKSIETFLLCSSITQSPFLLCGASEFYS